MMTLFKCFKCKAPQKFSCTNFIGWNLQKFSPANLSLFTGLYHLLVRISLKVRRRNSWKPTTKMPLLFLFCFLFIDAYTYLLKELYSSAEPQS